MNILQWLAPWEFSYVVIFAIGAAAVPYIRGSVRLSIRSWRQLSFWTGLTLLYLVSHTQFDFYSEHQFFVHRIQHTVLHHIAPFLIVLSRPVVILAAGTPDILLQYFDELRNQPFVRELIGILMHPVLQILLFVGLILFWLIPNIHFLAMLDWRYYRIMNWSMAINGIMFWGLAISPYRSWAQKYGPGWRIGMMLAIIPPQIIIGAVLFSITYELYPIYGICGRAFANIDALTDQQIGGLILWIPAAMMSVIGIIIVLRREILQ